MQTCNISPDSSLTLFNFANMQNMKSVVKVVFLVTFPIKFVNAHIVVYVPQDLRGTTIRTTMSNITENILFTQYSVEA